MALERTVKSYDNELNTLRTMISRMGGMAEAQLGNAVNALIERNTDAAMRVLKDDKAIDHLELEIEKLAIQIIALRGPMADDLREIVAALKISGMLERIGDYGKNIAKRATVLSHTDPIKFVTLVPQMAGEAKKMIRDILDAFVERDSEKAYDVWEYDRHVDNLYNSLFRELLTYMMENPKLITPCTHLLFIAKNIERIGDHATNIAEIVYYAVEGEMLEEKRPKNDQTSFTNVTSG